ncbi:hypothetical protein D3C75_934670 [compost metagenome]
MLIRHFRHNRDREPCRRLRYLIFTPVAARRCAVQDLGHAARLQTEIELDIMIAQVYIFPALRIFIEIIIRNRENITPVHTQRLKRFGKSVLMRIIAYDQESQCFSKCLIGAHLIDTRLLQDSGRFKDNIVEQIGD